MARFKLFTLVFLALGLNLNVLAEGETSAKQAVLFSGQINGASYQLTKAGIAFQAGSNSTLSMEWQGANEEVMVSVVDQAGNYQTAGSSVQLPGMVEKVVYENLYFNIDLVVYMPQTTEASPNKPVLRYEFVVYPGGNPADIDLAYMQSQVRMLPQLGDVQVEAAAGSLKLSAPVAWQELSSGGKMAVKVAFTSAGQSLGLSTGTYDQAQIMTLSYEQQVEFGMVSRK
ncbi:MAG: hypothetical protein AAFR61_01440 [Bacteroidota bacterium]